MSPEPNFSLSPSIKLEKLQTAPTFTWPPIQLIVQSNQCIVSWFQQPCIPIHHSNIVPFHLGSSIESQGPASIIFLVSIFPSIFHMLCGVRTHHFLHLYSLSSLSIWADSFSFAFDVVLSFILFNSLFSMIWCVATFKPCFHLHLSTSWIHPTKRALSSLFSMQNPFSIQSKHEPVPLLNLTHIASNHLTYRLEFIVFFPSLIPAWHGLSFVFLLFYFSHCMLYPHFVLYIYYSIFIKTSPPEPSKHFSSPLNHPSIS